MKTKEKNNTREIGFDMMPVWENLMPLFEYGEKLQQESEINLDGTFKEYSKASDLVDQYLEIRMSEITDYNMSNAGKLGIMKALLSSILSGDSPQSIISLMQTKTKNL